MNYYNCQRMALSNYTCTFTGHTIAIIATEDTYQEMAYQHLLERLQYQLWEKILEAYQGDYSDTEALRAFLPPQYKMYASNIHDMGEATISMDEVKAHYSILHVEKSHPCYGCINDCCGQRDHMECPTGCLHDAEMCGCK